MRVTLPAKTSAIGHRGRTRRETGVVPVSRALVGLVRFG